MPAELVQENFSQDTMLRDRPAGAARPRLPEAVFICALVVSILLAAWLILRVTRGGAGLSTDSRAYLMGARNLLAGNGLMQNSGPDMRFPLTHFAPLYPMMLAAGSRISGADAYAVARWLNVLFLAGTALFAAFVIKRISGSRIAAIIGTIILLSATDILRVHSMVWSESGYLAFSLASIWILAFYVCDGSRWALLIASIFAGLAFATRYAGASLPVAVALMVFFNRQKPLRKRAADTAISLALSCGPMALWLARNFFLSGAVANRQAGFHPPAASEWDAACATLSAWVIQTASKDLTKWLGLGICIVLWIGAAIASRLLTRADRVEQPDESVMCRELLRLLWTNAALYLLVILLTATFFDAYMPLDHRILAPFHVIFVIVVVATLTRLDAIRGGRLAKRLLILLVCTAFLFNQGKDLLDWSKNAPTKGLGYASVAWKNSRLIHYVKKLPRKSSIYSNGAVPLYLLANQLAKPIPGDVDPSSPRRVAAARNALMLMREDLTQNGGAIVYFKSMHGPAMSQRLLERKLPLKKIFTARDGAVYKLVVTSPTTATRPAEEPPPPRRHTSIKHRSAAHKSPA
jgi:hypothetical protein